MSRTHSEPTSKPRPHATRKHAAAMTSSAMLLATLLGGSCATTPPVCVAPLLNEARQNEVAAYGRNQGRDLHVAGVVLQTGMDSFMRVVAEGALGWGVSIDHVLEHSPYMIVGDDRTPTPDLVRCMFPAQDTEVVGRLTPGMRVTFHGTFHQYVHDGGRMLLVLSTCALD